MEKQLHTTLDDIVFENKNKDYGAYYNRITAGFDLMKSLFITIFGIGILVLILSFTLHTEETVITPEKEVTAILDPLITHPPVEKPKVEEMKSTVKVKTVKSDKTDKTVTPKKEVEKQTEMLDNKDISSVILGLEDSPGEENNSIKTVEIGNGNGSSTNTETVNEVKQPDNTNFLPRQVDQMAIFPGCEKYAKQNDNLQKCLSEQLQKELGGQLNDFSSKGIGEATARIHFIIDKSGKIIEIKAMNGSNTELGREAKSALERISKKMIQKGKFIEPAKFNDGTPVNLSFTIPVKFISN